MYFGVAANDDAQNPDAKVKLKEAFPAPSEVELYAAAQHGWCVPDMPAGATLIYKKDDAEKAWGKLLALYKAGIA
jgi:carboxymethylenebutenolidase